MMSDDAPSLELLDEDVKRAFDQQQTLAPPPYPASYRLSALVAGVERGDEALDALPVSELLRMRASGDAGCAADAFSVPAWVDRDACRRGQRLHTRLFLCFLTGLTSGLLHGFVIGRFSEVLSLAGYTKDDWTTFYRYRDTSNAIFSWMAYDLFDERSLARRNVVRVRAMHALARRAVRKQWDALAARDAQRIGVPLSQYDLALVQMAFCAMTLYFVEHQCFVTLEVREKADYCHLWRFIGHLLGIEHRYNIAVDCVTAERAFQEFLSIVPLLNKSVRPCCTALVRGTVDGFGVYTTASKDFYASLLYGAEGRIAQLTTEWTQLRRPSARYQQYVVGGLNPKAWWLPAFVWHFLFALFVRLQVTVPRFMHLVEVGSSHLSQRFKF
jgi:hypothetical protein